MKTILFISHDASRSGAPIILLNLIKWLKKYKNVSAQILLLENGPLFSDFNSVGDVYIYKKEFITRDKNQNIFIRILNKYIRSGNGTNESIFTIISQKKISLIYSNTVASNWVLPDVKKVIKAPVINHIHEMYTSIVTFYPDMLSNEIIKNINHFLFVTDLNLKMIQENYHISQEKTTIVSEFVDISKIKNSFHPNLNYLQNGCLEKMTVYSCGKMSFRKGKDYFFEVVKKIAFEFPDKQIEFVWLGEIDHEYVKYIDLDFEINRVRKNYKVIEPVLDPIRILKDFDLMILLSREDPFPLVVIEAAALGKPVIIFKNASGVQNSLIYGEHQIVKYGNVDQVVENILNYYSNPQLIKTTGEQNAHNSESFDINFIGEKISLCINSLIENERVN